MGWISYGLRWEAVMARLRDVRERGWAGRLLEWRQVGLRLEAAISRCRYFVQAQPFEVMAWAETRDDAAGRYRVEIGTFATEAEAQAACERDAGPLPVAKSVLNLVLRPIRQLGINGR